MGINRSQVLDLFVSECKAHGGTLGDAYEDARVQLLDECNKLPVVLGKSEDGGIMVRDLSKSSGICIVGLARRGKTWFLRSVLSQLSLFTGTNLQLYVYDAKGFGCDTHEVPFVHLEGYGTTAEAFLSGLRGIVDIARHRKSLIESEGYRSAEEYRDAHPDIAMPYLCVAVDEVVTFVDDLKCKGLYAEFVSCMQELMGYAYLGVHLLLCTTLAFVLLEDLNMDGMEFIRVEIEDEAIHLQSERVQDGEVCRILGEPYVLADSAEGTLEMLHFCDTLYLK